ncbi:MAG: hypothetical protein ACM3JJ_04450 [Hyphomicrobiales bacterium]
MARHRRLLPVVAALLLSCASPPTPVLERPAIEGKEVLPLTTVAFSGHRYVVQADLGLAHPVPLMVHGNARVYLMLTHRAAEALTGHPIVKREDYGYSAKGKGAIDVPEIRLGGRRFTRLTDVPVFDFTEEGDTTVQGMLGTRFLLAERAAVDFPDSTLLLGVLRSGAPNTRLLQEGYRYVPMTVSPDYRVTIDVTFPSLGRAIPITPSTVANALTLHRPLFAGRVAMVKSPSPDRSPDRTSPAEFAADSVRFEVGGIPFATPATFEDLAEYSNVPEKSLKSYGMLGYDWMAAHAAILDYANRALYFKP